MLIEPVGDDDECLGRGASRGRVEPGRRDPDPGPVERRGSFVVMTVVRPVMNHWVE